MEDLLTKITINIQMYKDLKDKLDFKETETILNIMKNLSSNLFFLEKYLDDERQAFYATIIKLLKNHSATEAEKRAKDLHPEKRMLERFIRSAERVHDSMKSHQSYLKSIEQ